MRYLNFACDQLEELSFELNTIFKITFLDKGKIIKISNNGSEIELTRKEYLKLLYEMSEILFEVRDAEHQNSKDLSV